MDKSNLVKRATALKARLNRLNTSFGLVQYRDVTLKIKNEVLINNVYVPEYQDYPITITPKVETIDTNQIGLEVVENVFLGKNDYKITIVRNITIPDFEYLIVDPIFDNQNKIIGGLKCKHLYTSENQLFDWVLYVRLMQDNFKL